MAKLHILTGKRQGDVVEIDEGVDIDIGNRKSAKLSIRDPWISYNHAKINGAAGRFVIEDLGSSNGTWINGQKVSRHELSAEDVIFLGKTKVKFLGSGASLAGEAALGDPALAPQAEPIVGGAPAEGARYETSVTAPLEAGSTAELHEERRMRQALERFLELPPGASVGDAARAGDLERELRELRAKVEAQTATTGGLDGAELQAALASEREKAERTRREHMSQVVELEGKVAQAEAKAVELERRLTEKGEQSKKEVERAKQRLTEEVDELRRALEEARASASELAAGGDGALQGERERAERLEKELEEWRAKAREAAERSEALEAELAEANASVEQAKEQAAEQSGQADETLRTQLMAAVEEASRWKDEAEHWKQEHAKVVQEIDEISMEQIEIEDELNRKVKALQAQLDGEDPSEEAASDDATNDDAPSDDAAE